MNPPRLKHVLTLAVIFLAATAACRGPARAEGTGGLHACDFAQLAAEPYGRSLGGAHVAVAGGPAALAWNPAGLAAPSSAGAMIAHASWMAGTAWQYGAVSLEMPGQAGTLGLSAGMLRIGSLPSYDAGGGATGEFSPFAAVGSLGYARLFGEHWQIGVCAEFFLEGDGAESPRQAQAGGVGIQYLHPFDFGRFAVGASALHMGASLEAGDETYRLPETYRVGLSLESHRGIDLHLAWEAVRDAHPGFSCGLSWRPTAGLAALGGLVHEQGYDESLLTPSLGLALDVGPTQVVYSYQPTVLDAGSHQVALYVPFFRR